MFDRVGGGVSKPGRSLFDRVEPPRLGLEGRISGRERARSRSRSRSPGAPRRTDTRKPAPEHIDRYVPRGGDDSGRESREPRGVRGGGRGRRDDRGGRGGRGGASGRQARPTQEQLDQEM